MVQQPAAQPIPRRLVCTQHWPRQLGSTCTRQSTTYHRRSHTRRQAQCTRTGHTWWPWVHWRHIHTCRDASPARGAVGALPRDAVHSHAPQAAPRCCIRTRALLPARNNPLVVHAHLGDWAPVAPCCTQGERIHAHKTNTQRAHAVQVAWICATHVQQAQLAHPLREGLHESV